MRIVVYGVGAIGGVLAVALSQAGHEVIGIARGRQLEAMRRTGLVMRTPDGDRRADLSTVADPNEIQFRRDDIVILAMKTQDTQAAVERLREAGVSTQPIFCAQNGIANDDMALRLFPNVFGIVVEIPADYITPGEVTCFFSPILGVLHVGRHGSGDTAPRDMLVAALSEAGFAAFAQDDIASLRYAKLFLNLGNAIGAVITDDEAAKPFIAAARAEAEAVYAKAGIVPADIKNANGGVKPQMRDVPGASRVGSSSTQSLVRGAGSIETDYLNGEIVLMGRKLGVPTPVNAWFAESAHRMVREGRSPGSIPIADIHKALGIGQMQ